MTPGDAMQAFGLGEVGRDLDEDARADLVALTVARGRIVRRLVDSSRGDYRVHVDVVTKHPDLQPGECFALVHWRASAVPRVYRVQEAAVRPALDHHGFFNFVG